MPQLETYPWINFVELATDHYPYHLKKKMQTQRGKIQPHMQTLFKQDSSETLFGDNVDTMLQNRLRSFEFQIINDTTLALC